MRNKLIVLLAAIVIFILFSLSGCGTGQVSVGVGVYVPGAWGGPYGAGYYPPVRVGYPIY
ncbi:MAG: hypothetical protein IPM14_14225 [bacterium]|nr:hypothetical protein [bacterium]